MRRNLLAFAPLLSAFLILSLFPGCGSGRRDESPDLIATGYGQATPAPPPPGLSLRAEATRNRVQLGLNNNLGQAVIAGPKFFAVVDPHTRQIMPFRHGVDVAQLPVKRLEPGESIQGVLVFKRHDDLIGKRLVFNPLNGAPVYCVIQPSADASARLPVP